MEWDGAARRLHGQSEDIIDFVGRLARGTGIEVRHSIHPALLAPGTEAEVEVEDIYTETDFNPDLWQRMRLWSEVVPLLAVKAVERALASWGGDPEDITHIITTGTSGWMEPGIACHVIHEVGLRDDCQKAELNFNGCFCGATCLRLARDIVRGGEAGHVLVVAAESATTHYSPVETDVSTLIANCLFSDGAAAFILGPDGPWRYERSGMSLVPGSRELLRMVPPMVPGRATYQMFLDRRVGRFLGDYFQDGPGATILDALVEDASPLPAIAVHPGGPDILNHIAEILRDRGYPEGMLETSYQTLRSNGNVGSAAMLFVLAQTLPDLKEDRLGTLAFGPGVTVEWGKYVQC